VPMTYFPAATLPDLIRQLEPRCLLCAAVGNDLIPYFLLGWERHPNSIAIAFVCREHAIEDITLAITQRRVEFSYLPRVNSETHTG
jgi:hypothetical protein